MLRIIRLKPELPHIIMTSSAVYFHPLNPLINLRTAFNQPGASSFKRLSLSSIYAKPTIAVYRN